MTDTKLKLAWAYDEAVAWSNWYFEAQDFNLAEYWNLRAEELLSAIQSRAAFEHAARTQ